MNEKKINQILAVSLIILGILSILLGIFDSSIPHSLRMAASIVQILVGCGVIYTVIIKLKGKF